jgi:hypothetical protein
MFAASPEPLDADRSIRSLTGSRVDGHRKFYHLTRKCNRIGSRKGWRSLDLILIYEQRRTGKMITSAAWCSQPRRRDPSFDVATIKPSDTSAPRGTFFRTNGRHVIAHNISVGGLIAYAHGLHEKQIADGPSSLLATHFDIDGLPDIEGHRNLKQSRFMFRNCSSLVSS